MHSETSAEKHKVRRPFATIDNDLDQRTVPRHRSDDSQSLSESKSSTFTEDKGRQIRLWALCRNPFLPDPGSAIENR